MIKLSKKILSGIFFFALALLFYSQIPQKMTLTWYLPKFYSIVVMLLSGGLILSGIITWKKEDKDKILVDIKKVKQSEYWKTIAFMGMLLAYFILISILGMVVTTALFIIGFYLFLGVKDIKVILLGLLIMGVVYCAFAFGLKVRFPHGLLY